MCVSHLRGTPRVFDDGFHIVGKEGANWRNTHRGTVPEGALSAEQFMRRFPPRHLLPNLREQPMHARAIAAPRLALIVLCETVCKLLLLDSMVVTQHLHD